MWKAFYAGNALAKIKNAAIWGDLMPLAFKILLLANPVSIRFWDKQLAFISGTARNHGIVIVSNGSSIART